MRLRLVIFLALGSLFSCQDKKNTEILKPEKMQAVLWDIIRADNFTTDFIKKDSTKNPNEENIKMQIEIFAMHKITKDNFYNSLAYYKNNTGLLKPILDSIIIKAEKTKQFNVTNLEAQ